MLTDIRKLFGYTQEDLAKRIGIDQRYYTQLETGATKSSRFISKVSEILKIKESFITSLGEYVEYPFLSDFYVFCITERKILPYEFIAKYICSKSTFIDIAFFLVSSSLFKMPLRLAIYPVLYIAIKDDRNTIFLFKRRIKTRSFSVAGRRNESKELEFRTFPRIDIFRTILHSLHGTYMHEITVMLDEQLFKKLEEATVTRDDLLPYFPNINYFLKQYEAHTKIKER